jgi:hypothetical protein
MNLYGVRYCKSQWGWIDFSHIAGDCTTKQTKKEKQISVHPNDASSLALLDAHVNLSNQPCGDKERQHTHGDRGGLAQGVDQRMFVGNLWFDLISI